MTGTHRTPSAKISAVVSDVDGTLVTDDKALTARVQAAVADLGTAGIAFAIVSSRPPRGMRMLLEPLEITTPVCGFNGGLIATPTLTTISEHLLPLEVACQAVDMLAACGAAPWIFCGEEWLVRRADGPYVGLEQRTVRFGPTVVDDFGPHLDSAAKIVGASADFERLAQCESEMKMALRRQATVALSQPYYLDITHTLANKGEALAAIAGLLAIPLTEIAVIGDGGNDVAMFERGGLSIAMGNASPEVKLAADFVTGSNRDDGFAQAVETIILGGKRPRSPTAPVRESRST
jgi:Cof subfamily protein (haloacid dehalogenase superfamily)